ncbi:dihydrofolate reductase [Rhizobium sp. KVB221]|uniref:Dihydrofolate reductase n=1 Tax=Rhizobium setariae TaxID=2801340 RepID=A0A936YRY1_9HYPH|nr:dihydrofolate reductase family protein [Rhizobium setariae]MBL0371502.1 dihydrofolate reductase [Rhizobium setariae]
MRRLTSFTNITLDGYFSGPDGDFSWAHDGEDEEFNNFVADNARSGGALLMGRVTYDLMASYWPTPFAAQNDPVVAERMNAMPKLVASRSIEQPEWQNTRILRGELVAEIAALKQEEGDDIAILGSGSIIKQLAEAQLIDEYQLVINPVVLGDGRTPFEGLRARADMKLCNSRIFSSGKVFLSYAVR